MNLWLWLLIVFAGSSPTLLILWLLYCRRDDEGEE